MQDLEIVSFHELPGQLKLLFKRREEGIPIDGSFNQSQIEVRTQRQRLPINLSAAANENLPADKRCCGGLDLVQVGDGSNTWNDIGGTGQHNRRAIWQRLADRFERPPAHDNYVTRGHLLEPFEIFGQMPGNPIAGADDAVHRHGGNGFERLQHRECCRIQAGTSTKGKASIA